MISQFLTDIDHFLVASLIAKYTGFIIASPLWNRLLLGVHYYEKFQRRYFSNVFHRLHNRLVEWILNKHKQFKESRKKAFEYLKKIHKHYPYLFYHWQVGYALK